MPALTKSCGHAGRQPCRPSYKVHQLYCDTDLCCADLGQLRRQRQHAAGARGVAWALYVGLEMSSNEGLMLNVNVHRHADMGQLRRQCKHSAGAHAAGNRPVARARHSRRQTGAGPALVSIYLLLYSGNLTRQATAAR